MKILLLTILNFLCIYTSIAQVTIGAGTKPAHGAILELTNITEQNGANANKGLMLPRVALTSITNLYPMFETTYDKSSNDLSHTGLTVYNTNETLYNGDGKGLYYWDGEKWESVGLTKKQINANAKNIQISEINPTAETLITTIPANLPFSMSMEGKESSTCTVSGQNLKFEINPVIGGLRKYSFTLENSDRSVKINVDQLKLNINKSLFKVGENGTISSSSAVTAEGGSEDWFVKSYTTEGFNWVVPPHNENKNLSFTLGTIEQEGTTEGTITVGHVDDPNYTKEITINQNKDYIVLPEFDYLVIQYVYSMDELPANVSRVDLDTATEISDTEATGINNQPVGWALGSTKSYLGKNYMFWPGDNTQTGYESVYVNMTLVTHDYLSNSIKREFNVDMYATWFYPTRVAMGDKNLIKINITLYKGGTMENVNTYDYQNNGGKKVFELLKTDMPVTTYQGVNTFRTSYTKMLRLEYDKEDNTGVLVPLPTTLSNRLDDTIMPDMNEGETKDDYAKRMEKYRNQKNK